MPYKLVTEFGNFSVWEIYRDGSRKQRLGVFESEKRAKTFLAGLQGEAEPEQDEVAPQGAEHFQEMETVSGAFHDTMVISELRGQYPTVPLAEGVDYEALILGDPNPTFLTIPIGRANIKSANKRYYDEAFLQELERQTLLNKPVGLMGHLSDAQRATEFPTEAIHWVGAKREADMLWGKGYVPPGPVRERIARYKAQGKTLATSIDAHAEGEWDEKLDAYRMKASTLKLGQIDLAPADRAGIPSLAAVPHLTHEMSETQEEQHMPTKLEILSELTADDARLLPASVRDAILATVAIAPEVATVQEMRSTLGLDDKADVLASVKEIKEAIEANRKAEVQNHIKELVEDKEKGIKVEAVRGLVTELIVSRKPQTVAEADSAFTEICELPSVKSALELTVQNTMGPAQRGMVPPQNGKGHYFAIPEEK